MVVMVSRCGFSSTLNSSSSLLSTVSTVVSSFFLSVSSSSGPSFSLMLCTPESLLVLSPRQIITGKKLVLPSYPTGSFVYAVKDGTMNSIDNMRTFDALYLRPNDEGGEHFVYNIATMQRSSVCRVIGINKKPIPMTDLILDLINMQ